MRRILSYLPFLAAASVFAALFETARHPSFLPYAAAALGAVLIATSGTLCYQALWRRSAIAPGAMPSLLIGGTAFAFIYLEDATIRMVIALAASILFFVLVRRLSASSRMAGADAELRALSEWSALVALVGLAAGLLASATFLNLNVWLAALIFAAVASFAVFALSRLGKVTGFLTPAAVSFLLAQGFVVVGMLPTSHWVWAGVLGALSYLLITVLSPVPPSALRRIIFSVGAICATLLATARWR